MNKAMIRRAICLLAVCAPMAYACPPPIDGVEPPVSEYGRSWFEDSDAVFIGRVTSVSYVMRKDVEVVKAQLRLVRPLKGNAAGFLLFTAPRAGLACHFHDFPSEGRDYVFFHRKGTARTSMDLIALRDVFEKERKDVSAMIRLFATLPR